MTDIRRQLAPLPLSVALLLSGCQGGDSAPSGGNGADRPQTLTVYSGRNEKLIGPLLERFEQQSGIDVQVRYADTSELTATLLEEGQRTPAALFIAQDAAALGALSVAGGLTRIPAATLERVSARFRSPRGDWIGLSGRARVVVYNTERIEEQDLPQNLLAATEPRYRGRFGVAPNNASFQSHMAAFAAINGEQALVELLAGLAANQPKIYPKNSPIVAAVIAGEIDWGLVNHYYLLRALAESPDAPARNFVMPATDGSGFVNIAGAGLLRDTPAAIELMDFLISSEAQRYFSDETFEYALVGDPSPATGEAATGSQPNFRAVSGLLETTLGLIRDSGLTRFQ